VGRHPLGALLGQDAAGDQGMQVKVRLQDLIPGCVAGPTLCKTMVAPS
jgi:hypothetical protein